MKVIEWNRVVEAMAEKYPSYQKVAQKLEQYVFEYVEDSERPVVEDPRIAELQYQLKEANEQLEKTIKEANEKLKNLDNESQILKDTIVRMSVKYTH